MSKSLNSLILLSLAGGAIFTATAVYPAGSMAAQGIKLLQSTDGCAERRHFIDVSTFSHNGRYDDPKLDISCSDEHIVISTNTIINYEYVQITPTDLAVRNRTYRIPRQPRRSPDPQRVPLLGPIGVAINGVPIFSANEAPQHNWGDPMPLGILDFCNGHTARGFYHYHARPNCLVLDNDGSVGQVLAYAFDGYPIVSPYICMAGNCKAKIKLRSSYRLIDDTPNAPAWEANKYQRGFGDLDECNGRELPGGGYAYFFTERFPYSLACYAGEPLLSGNTRGGGNADRGPGRGRGERAGRRGPPPGGPGFGGPPPGGGPRFAEMGGRPGDGGRIEPFDGGTAGLQNLADRLNGKQN